MANKTWYSVFSSESIGLASNGAFPTKEEITNIILSDMFQKTSEFAVYKDLPDIESWQLELFLQTKGSVMLKEVNGTLYDFFGGYGGEPDVYYYPTVGTVSNPALKYNASLELDKDCIWMKNDRFCEGLLPWNTLYAKMMAEAYITMRLALVNARAENIISANTDSEEKGAQDFLRDLEKGEKIGYLTRDGFLSQDRNASIPYSTSASINAVRTAVESLQYIQSQWASGLGISMPYNSKREYVSSEDTDLGEEITAPRIDQMMACRKEAIDKLNKMYGLHASVDFGGLWLKKKHQEELTEQLQEKVLEEPEKENKKNEGDNNI